MNDFFVGALAQDIGNLARPQPFDAIEILAAVVCEPTGNFNAVGALQGYDVAFGKAAIDFDDPRSQQAAAFG